MECSDGTLIALRSKTVRCHCPHLSHKSASNRFRGMRRAAHRSAWMIWYRSSTAPAAVSPVQQSEPGRRADRQPHCHRHSLPDCAFSLVGSLPNTALSSFAKRSSNAIALFAADSSTSSAEICRRDSSDAIRARGRFPSLSQPRPAVGQLGLRPVCRYRMRRSVYIGLVAVFGFTIVNAIVEPFMIPSL